MSGAWSVNANLSAPAPGSGSTAQWPPQNNKYTKRFGNSVIERTSAERDNFVNFGIGLFALPAKDCYVLFRQEVEGEYGFAVRFKRIPQPSHGIETIAGMMDRGYKLDTSAPCGRTVLEKKDGMLCFMRHFTKQQHNEYIAFVDKLAADRGSQDVGPANGHHAELPAEPGDRNMALWSALLQAAGVALRNAVERARANARSSSSSSNDSKEDQGEWEDPVPCPCLNPCAPLPPPIRSGPEEEEDIEEEEEEEKGKEEKSDENEWIVVPGRCLGDWKSH